MSLLKQLFQSFIQTSLPLVNPGSNQVSQSLTSSNQTVVAPLDGFAVVVAGNLPNIDAINIENHGVQSFIPAYLNAWGCAWVPCRKGQQITISTNGSSLPSLRFVEAQFWQV